MKTVKCAIIEDEPIGAKTLESLLKPYKAQFKIEVFAKSLNEAREIFNRDDIDLVFADIELLDGNIFEVLEGIDIGDKQIVFTTAYEEFGAKAFSYPALHYLLKPINPGELEKALNRYNNLSDKDGELLKGKVDDNEYALEKLSLPTQNGMVFLDFDEVIRMQSSNKYSIIFTSEGKQHIVSKALTKFEEMLNGKGFLRVHDSHIINLHHLKGYLKGKGGEIVMSDGSHVPVSVRRKDALASVLKHPL